MAQVTRTPARRGARGWHRRPPRPARRGASRRTRRKRGERPRRLVAWVRVRVLIFSDIHNDWKALERLLAVEADLYIAAGDQVSWGKGLDRCGEILQSRGDRMYVLPGNHETAAQIAAMCERYGLHDFHGQRIR